MKVYAGIDLHSNNSYWKHKAASLGNEIDFNKLIKLLEKKLRKTA